MKFSPALQVNNSELSSGNIQRVRTGAEQDIDKTGIDRHGQGNKENEAGLLDRG